MAQQDSKRAEETCVRGFGSYFALCFLGVCAASVLTVALWSSIGSGKACLGFLQENEVYRYGTFGGSCCIVFILYIFDCFSPPHLPGQHFALFDGDRLVGRACFGISILLFVASCFFQAKEYPSVPLVASTMLGPIFVSLVRVSRGNQMLKLTNMLHRLHHIIPIVPSNSPQEVTTDVDSEKKQQSDTDDHANVLIMLRRQEKDTLHFFQAAAASFLGSAVIVLIVWLVWAATHDHGMDEISDTDEKEQLYILWSAPLVLAVSNFIFGFMTLLRVLVHKQYAEIEQSDAAVKEENRQSALDETKDATVRQLTTIIKVVGCVFMLLIGLLYVAGQLLYSDSKLATMVMAMMGSFFLVFIVFTYVSFRRVVIRLHQTIAHMPIWKTASAIVKNNWMRAMVICPLLPYIPFVLAVSWLNQSIRKLRGLYDKQSAAIDGDLKTSQSTLSVSSNLNYPDPKGRSLTPRVDHGMINARDWDFLAIMFRCYVLCFVYVCYTICPLLLNVGLSWVNNALQKGVEDGLISFESILVMVFFIGLVAFMLPPVPGMTIYIFGGLVITKQCPWGDGFWTGAFINVMLGWFLKLVACALQQKGIGGLMGKSAAVRQQIGVHTVGVRCIEAVLKEPGFTIGKVAILCGGPDWPTSVTAGILNLSLIQCEIGTLPIIGFIAPCSLSGSFYLKKAESEMWSKSAQMMVVASVFINLVLWAVAAWAIQGQLEKNHDEVSKPLKHNVNLCWMDYREAEILKTASVRWSQGNMAVKYIYLIGVLVQIGVCQVMFMCYYSLFGTFEVTDYIGDIVWYGEPDASGENGGIFTFYGVMTLAAYGVSFIPFYIFRCWAGAYTRQPRADAAKVVDATEAKWKADYVLEAEEWSVPSTKLVAVQPQCPTEEQDAASSADVIKDPAAIDPSARLPLPDEECQPHCPANVNPSKVALDVVTGKETIGQGRKVILYA